MRSCAGIKKYVITVRKDEIAKDIIDRMFKDDLNDTCGVSYLILKSNVFRVAIQLFISLLF
jgi:hypothetical protein